MYKHFSCPRSAEELVCEDAQSGRHRFRVWEKTDVGSVVDVVTVRADVGIGIVEHLISEGFSEIGPCWKLLQECPKKKNWDV